MRGEKKEAYKQTGTIWGSPPHARGKVDIDIFQMNLLGITPACAGKSATKTLQTGYDKDHPRMRGEKQWH